MMPAMMAAAGQIRPMQAAGMPPQMAVAAQQQNAAAVAAAMANPQRANYKYTQGKSLLRILRRQFLTTRYCPHFLCQHHSVKERLTFV